MMPFRNKNGFTLVEILLVIIIAGSILAVVVPMAYRAWVNAKYQVLRQNCVELARWANEWAQRELDNQPDTAASNLEDYMATLAGSGAVVWVGQSAGANNWQAGTALVQDRGGTGVDLAPGTSVSSIMPKDKQLINPFNGLSMFSSGNVPGAARPVPGATGCAYASDTDTSGTVYHYFALIFQGTDATSGSDFYAGQGTSLAGLRNGVFIGRLKP
jgi:prepilin-type N-terminal cleavage/methylation domain-containing protein